MEIYENRNIKDLDGEIWKSIDGFDDYFISNFGRVKSFKRYEEGKILKQSKNKNGYLFIRLYKNRKPEIKKIHILIFEVFNNYISKKNKIIHHMDLNKQNNKITNLQLMSEFEHTSLYHSGMKHSEKTLKLMCKNHNKLEEWQVKSIYQISNSPIIKQLKITQKEIGDIFRVNRSTISNIKSGKSWKHLGDII